MKRDDAAIAHAAAELALGSLSSVEDELAGAAPLAESVREDLEDQLYFHLRVARNALLALEQLPRWGQAYVLKYREREHALAAAARLSLYLSGNGGFLSPLLAEMVLAEEGLSR